MENKSHDLDYVPSSLRKTFAIAESNLDRARAEFESHLRSEKSSTSSLSSSSAAWGFDDQLLGDFEEESKTMASASASTSNANKKPKKFRGVPTQGNSPDEKGKEIYVRGGDYIGCVGWLNASANAVSKAKNSIHFLLLASDGETTVKKRLHKSNVKEQPFNYKPDSVLQMVFHAVPKVEKRLVDLMRDIAKIAEVHLDSETVSNELASVVQEYFNDALKNARKEQRGWTVLSAPTQTKKQGMQF